MHLFGSFVAAIKSTGNETINNYTQILAQQSLLCNSGKTCINGEALFNLPCPTNTVIHKSRLLIQSEFFLMQFNFLFLKRAGTTYKFCFFLMHETIVNTAQVTFVLNIHSFSSSVTLGTLLLRAIQEYRDNQNKFRIPTSLAMNSDLTTNF